MGTPTNEATTNQYAVVATSVPPVASEKQESALERTILPNVACSCIQYVKMRLGGISESWGYPNKMKAYEISPYVGGVVVTTEGPVGHVALIEAIEGTTLTVSEANYVRCKITRRTIEMNAPQIRGYR